MMKCSIRFFILYLLGVCSSFLVLYILSLTLDPYGLINNKDKNIANLTTQDSFVVSAKLESPMQYVLLGTSRTLRIDPLLPQNYLHSKVTHLGFHGQSISQWNMILEKVKQRNINVILGLDSFSLNQFYDEKLNLGVKLFKDAMNKNSNFYFLHKIFIEEALFSPITKYYAQRDAILQFYDTERINPYSYEDIALFTVGREKGGGRNYSISKEKVDTLVGFLKKGDIIILFPKYYLWYKVFSQTSSLSTKTIQDCYFDVIKQIVKTTNAKVWSFYGINTITLNKENFDNLGQHFKPKISPLIFARIFNDKNIKVPEDFGVLLTKENIDEELEKIKKIEKQYFQE